MNNLAYTGWNGKHYMFVPTKYQIRYCIDNQNDYKNVISMK